MATYTSTKIQQSTGEIRKWTFDFTDDIPSGATVLSGTATHTPPSGSAASLTITASSPYVYVQLGPLTVTGIHFLDATATFSNGEKSEIRLTFTVNYPAAIARSGLSDLISSLRKMTYAGPNDFDIAGVPYWTDKQLEEELDTCRTELYRELLEPVETYNNGTVQFKEYHSGYGNFEQTTGGTSIFYLENAAGTIFGTALYSIDYRRGHVTFNSDTTGSAVYLYGRSYDLNAAAANIWRFKAGYYAEAYDFSTDGMRANRSQLIEHCERMANKYEGMRQPESISLFRSDIT